MNESRSSSLEIDSLNLEKSKLDHGSFRTLILILEPDSIVITKIELGSFINFFLYIRKSSKSKKYIILRLIDL